MSESVELKIQFNSERKEVIYNNQKFHPAYVKLNKPSRLTDLTRVAATFTVHRH